MNRRSITAGLDRTEMAGARLELNGASKSHIIVTEPEPVQYHVASLVQKAPVRWLRLRKEYQRTSRSRIKLVDQDPCSGYSTGSDGSAPATLAPMT
jgi:hypothetical protein